MAVNNNGLKGVANHLEEIKYKTELGFSNIVTAHNWALSWSNGRPPGGIAYQGDIRQQWMAMIYKDYDPAKDTKPKAKKESKKAAKKEAKKVPAKKASDKVAPVKAVDPPKKRRGDPMTSEEATKLGIKGQSSSIDPADGVDDYSDLAELLDSGRI